MRNPACTRTPAEERLFAVYRLHGDKLTWWRGSGRQIRDQQDIEVGQGVYQVRPAELDQLCTTDRPPDTHDARNATTISFLNINFLNERASRMISDGPMLIPRNVPLCIGDTIAELKGHQYSHRYFLSWSNTPVRPTHFRWAWDIRSPHTQPRHIENRIADRRISLEAEHVEQSGSTRRAVRPAF